MIPTLYSSKDGGATSYNPDNNGTIPDSPSITITGESTGFNVSTSDPHLSPIDNSNLEYDNQGNLIRGEFIFRYDNDYVRSYAGFREYQETQYSVISSPALEVLNFNTIKIYTGLNRLFPHPDTIIKIIIKGIKKDMNMLSINNGFEVKSILLTKPLNNLLT